MLPSIETGSRTGKRPRALQYYLHDDPDAFRLELAGSLTSATADSVYHAWRTAQSTLGGRPAVVDITFLERADDRGRDLLMLWHSKGARIVASSPESRAIAGGIAWESPLPSQPAKGFGARLMGFLRGVISGSRVQGASNPRAPCFYRPSRTP